MKKAFKGLKNLNLIKQAIIIKLEEDIYFFDLLLFFCFLLPSFVAPINLIFLASYQ